MQKTFDVLIIGGGIVGCAAAFYASRRGARVALIERGELASGTTSNSFAWINATSKVADPDYHHLNAQGQAGYRALAVEFGEQAIGLNRCGMLQWASRADRTRFAELETRCERLRELDYPVTWVTRAELRALEPHIAFGNDDEGLYAMADPCLDAPRAARFLAEQVRIDGGEILEHCAAEALLVDGAGSVTGVRTASGPLQAPRVLIAVGPSTPEVLAALTGYAPFASRFPVRRVPGLLVTTPSTAPAELIRHVVYADTGAGVHVLPTPGGGLKIGADDTDGMIGDGDPSPAILRSAALELLTRAQSLLPGFSGPRCIDACTMHIGIRPYPQDGRTLAGPVPGSNGLFVAATHSGVTLAPAVGALLSGPLTGTPVPEALRPFGLERLPAFR